MRSYYLDVTEFTGRVGSYYCSHSYCSQWNDISRILVIYWVIGGMTLFFLYDQ